MSHITSGRWLTVGGSVAGIAAAVAIAIWQASPPGGFWQAPGIAALACVGLGLAMMLVGFFKRDVERQSLSQVQRAGANSTSFQAGRDINVGREKSKEEAEQEQ